MERVRLRGPYMGHRTVRAIKRAVQQSQGATTGRRLATVPGENVADTLFWDVGLWDVQEWGGSLQTGEWDTTLWDEMLWGA